MAEYYSITYQAENTYDFPVIEASWQFLIIPEENPSQSRPEIRFTNSEATPWELSRNGFGFPVIRIRNRHSLESIRFEARFALTKQAVNPFDFDPNLLLPYEPERLRELPFRIRFDTFLRHTPLTRLPQGVPVFSFEPGMGVLENLQALNTWVYEDIRYTPGLTHVDTTLDEILDLRKGVCQDFAHLFIGIARAHGIPARYVSGYLHQGLGFFGDAQMHAWVEAYLPDAGWIGFDPTNNMLAASDHIKVAHGRDYNDCAPLKGVVYGPGSNASRHQVQVSTQQ